MKVNSVIFDFAVGKNGLTVEAWYDNLDGVPVITDLYCQMRDEGEFFNFDPDGLFVLARDFRRKLVGGTEPLTDAIKAEAYRRSCLAIDDRVADEADCMELEHNPRMKDEAA